MRKLFVFFIFAIIYGSLFPFSFTSSDGAALRWDMLFNSFYPFTSLGDILGNIILFIPFGFLGFETISISKSGKSPYLKILFYGFLLATILQFIQVYIPSRSPSFADVYWNEVGILVGIVFAKMIRNHYPKLIYANLANIPVMLALFWLIYLFFPFVPTLDLQEIKNSIKPLILSPEFEWEDYLISLTGWLVFSICTRNVFQNIYLDRYRLAVFSCLSLPVSMIIVSNSITFSKALAIFSALILYPLIKKSSVQFEKILVILIICTTSVYGIGSMDFVSLGSGFSWVPFSGYLEGSMFLNTRSLFFKIFLFGSLIWFSKAAFPKSKLKFFYIFIFVLTIEVLQSFMVSHSGEITDPLFILIMIASLREKKKPFDLHHEDTEKPAKIKQEKLKTVNEKDVDENAVNKRKIYILLASILLISILLSIVIRLPGMPYNVRETFRLDGLFIAIIPFQVFILWFAMSIPLISKTLLNNPTRHWIRFPLLVLGSGLISYLILELSITGETMTDITGSSNIYRLVVNENYWGDFGIALSNMVPIDGLWNQLEEVVRFLSLLLPVIFMLCLFYHSTYLINKYNITSTKDRVKFMSFSLSVYLLYALPWLFISKLISFDYPNTDNLIELIAADGFFGLGGGGYLYLFFILLSFNIVWANQSTRHWAIKLAGIITAGIIGWGLINLGLEQEIYKYDTVYSGVDFLLGPDRVTKIDTGTLFLRWIILYISGVAFLAWSMGHDILSLLNIQKYRESFNRK